MPIELTPEPERGHEKFYFGNHEWEELLYAAKDNGWIPKDAPDENWERLYFSSDGNLVSARDASALAETLMRLAESSSPNEKKRLNEIAAFCRKGGFRIE
jgi:hypothetical protein